MSDTTLPPLPPLPTMPPVRIMRRTLFPPFRIGIRQLTLYHDVVTRDVITYIQAVRRKDAKHV